MSIIPHWPAEFRARYGGSWPRSYVAFDTETSGFKRDQDVIVELGHVLVEDGVVVDRVNVVLDWTGHRIVKDDWLARRLENVRYHMGKKGQRYHMTMDRMRKEGVRPPEKVLTFYLELFEKLSQGGYVFAAHNGYFDESMLAHNIVGFRVAEGFAFDDNELIDTMALERASQLVGDPRVTPRPDDSLRSYFRRMAGVRGEGVHADLEGHCATKYGFADRPGVDMARAHTAGFDAYLVHLLMEEHAAAAQAAAPPQPRRGPVPLLKRAARKEATSGGPFDGLPPLKRPGPARRRGQRNR